MPETVQILAALLVLKVKALRALDAVAVKVIGATPSKTGEAGAKVTVWAPGLMTTLAFADALAKLALPA